MGEVRTAYMEMRFKKNIFFLERQMSLADPDWDTARESNPHLTVSHWHLLSSLDGGNYVVFLNGGKKNPICDLSPDVWVILSSAWFGLEREERDVCHLFPFAA